MTEKEFLKSELESTPHSILEELFKNFDNKRIQTEEKMTKLRSKIKMLKSEHAEIIEDLKTLSGAELEDGKEGMRTHKEMLDNKIKEWEQLRADTKTLWKNQVIIGEILGYDLEE